MATTPPDVHPMFQFSNTDMLELCTSISQAEDQQLPGAAKQAWVISVACQKRAQSPPPFWIWLLIAFLENVIPKIIEYLKGKFGADWKIKAAEKVAKGILPWQS